MTTLPSKIAGIGRLGLITGALAFSPIMSNVVFAEDALVEVAGCGPAAATPPENLIHEPARCDPGYPAPKPFAEKTPFSISTLTMNVEYNSVLAIALAKGEFEKENLDITVHTMPSSDGLQMMAQGRIDSVTSAPDGGFHNGVAQGFDIRWVAGNFSPPAANGAGLWAKKGTTLNDLRGEIIGSVVGAGSVISMYIVDALKSAGMELKDVTLQRFETASLITALDNGGAKAIWLTDPAWARISNDPNYVRLAAPAAYVPTGGIIFGPTILNDRPEVGEAFLRAYIRTINTYLSGDYKADPAFITELSKVLNLPEENLRIAPSAVWDWEIRDGTTDRLQAAMMAGGALKYDTPIPQEKLIDRSFYQKVVGRK